MANKTFFPPSSFSFLSVYVFLFIFSFGIASCEKGINNVSNDLPNASTNQQWLSLSITFKSNSTEAVRNDVIKEVQRLVISELSEVKRENFHANPPTFLIDKEFFQNSPKYLIRVIVSDGGAGPTPPCKCPSCGVCPKANAILVNNVPVSEYVDSITVH